MNSNATTEIESEECPEATDGQQKEGRTESELKRTIKRAVRMQREAQEERERSQHEADVKRWQEAAARAAKAREARKLDLDQAHSLMDGISRIVEGVGGDSYKAPPSNARRNPPPDCMERKWRLGDANIELAVFPMEHRLDGHAPGVVSFAGMLRDENGYGLNYVLMRHSEDDASGKWYVKPEYPGTSARRQGGFREPP